MRRAWQVSPPNARGEYSLGLAADYLVPAIDVSRAIVAEVNSQVPWTHTERLLAREISTSWWKAPGRPPCRRRAFGERERAIARNAAAFVPTARCSSSASGRCPMPCAARSRGRGLRVHSGSIGDGVVELMERRIVSHVDCAMLIGSRRLFDHARDNERVRLRSSEYTHGAEVLARQPRSSRSTRPQRST